MPGLRRVHPRMSHLDGMARIDGPSPPPPGAWGKPLGRPPKTRCAAADPAPPCLCGGPAGTLDGTAQPRGHTARARMCWQVDALPVLKENGSVNIDVAFFTISYVVINVWTILQVMYVFRERESE